MDKENKKEEIVAGKRKRIEGTVVSNKMEKAVVVLVSRKHPHKKYGKVITETKRYYARAEKELNIGDTVIIEESRPLSKLIRWKVIEVKKS